MSPPRRPPGRSGLAVRLALALAIFALGAAFGAALAENPGPGGTHTELRTLRPGTLEPPTVTVTVTAPAG